MFADIGAGTGKFTKLLARYGNELLAVEPNKDMLEQLKITLADFLNTKIVEGTAEQTNLPDHSVDVIINAQSLNRFDITAFRLECERIGKSNPTIITLYNIAPPYQSPRYDKSTKELYINPVVRGFENTIFFTKENWPLYFLSMEGVPQDLNSEFMIEKKKIFDRDNVDGILRHNLITKVYSEKLF